MMLSLYGCLDLIWKLILAHAAMFGFRRLRSYMLPRPFCGLDKLLIEVTNALSGCIK